LPLYLAMSSLLWPRKITTSPTTLPLVLGAQPAAAMVSVRPFSGSISLAVHVPRSQPTGIVHGSRWTLVRPYDFIFSAVHSLARLRLSEPVRRGPITSLR